MEWTDMEYLQITVINIAERMIKRQKARKVDLQNIMEPRSYGCMTYIHYTFPKHTEKKIQMQLPTHIQTTSEIFIHLQTFFEYLLCTKFWRLRINL